jgi:2-haloacid dehalogenase
MALDVVVFDIGGVLIEWDPRRLYSKLLPEPAMEDFLARICTMDWHAQHDLGLPFSETIPPLVAAHPEWATEIRAWGERFAEMWSGPLTGTEALVTALRQRGIPLYAATNWGRDNWVQAKQLFPCLHGFTGELVSGRVGVIKPDPKFFDLLVESFHLDPGSSLYVDDNPDNVAAAAARGFVCHHFVGPAGLRRALQELGLLPQPGQPNSGIIEP